MFRFHDIPAANPATAGVHAGSQKAALHSIIGAWRPWRTLFPNIDLTPSVFLHGGTTRLSRALLMDTKYEMPLPGCKALLDLYLSCEFGLLGTKGLVARLPQHHKRIAAELVSSPASISAAQRCGYQFFANKEMLNALMKDLWVKPWKGKGPDFLMSGPNGSAFMEAKGSTGAAKIDFYDFCVNKAQSVNAQLRPFGGLVPTRHVLSQVFAPPGDAMSVHWFNQEERDEEVRNPQLEAVVLVATGLAQFVTQIGNAGYDASSLLAGMFVLPAEARRGHGFVLAPRTDYEYTIGVSYAALRLFSDISSFFSRLREKPDSFEPSEASNVTELANRLLSLRSFFGTQNSAWRSLPSRPIYTYSTGIFLLGPRDR